MDNNDYMVVMKATQCGISEYLIVRTIVNAGAGRNVFYVLPTYDLVGRFVGNRVNRAMTSVPYYKDLVASSDSATASGMLLKHVGIGAISFVGSNSSVPFTEFPADELIVDELDACNKENLHMAIERLSASSHKKICKVSNPTYASLGIDIEWNKSDKKKWYIKCSGCGEWINPDFFKHILRQGDNNNWVIIDKDYDKFSGIDINAICHKCNKPFDRFVDGRWVSTERSNISGYSISKMFSTTMRMDELVERFSDGLFNSTAMQRFYNGDLGLPFTAKGAKIDDEMLDNCIQDYLFPNDSKGVCVAGIDVGAVLHIIISEVLDEHKLKVVYIGEMMAVESDITEIKDLFKKYNVRCFVVDALPETRLSKKLVANMLGFICFIGSQSREILVNANDRSISVMRTAMLDSVKEQIMLKNLLLPKNVKVVKDFYGHMTCSVRVFDDKREKYDWEHGNTPDHYFFAMAFMLLARRTLLMMAGSQNGFN